MSEHTHAEINIRRYLVVFGCMIATALITVGIALAPLGSHKLNIALALVVVLVQAFLVLGFMMHLLSEKHMIYTVLAFTGFFLVALMVLTISSVSDVVTKPRHAPEATTQTKS
jgi:caa(3)-type oxidase subunit IV